MESINELRTYAMNVTNIHYQDILDYADAIEQEIAERTCKDVGIPGDFACSACGARMFTKNNDGHTMCLADQQTIIESPNYCPHCGAKVVAGGDAE